MNKLTLILAVLLTLGVCMFSVALWQWSADIRSVHQLESQNAQLQTRVSDLNAQIDKEAVQVSVWQGYLDDQIGVSSK
jgi:CHASE3 domain sensor protein